MSWESYVNDRLVGKNNIAGAAIFDPSSLDTLAASEGFLLPPDEKQQLIDIYDGKGDPDQLQIALKHYTSTEYSGRKLVGMSSPQMVVIVKAEKAVIVAQLASASNLAEATKAVEKLADEIGKS